MSSGLPARRAALTALAAVEVDGAWSNVAVPAAVGDLVSEQDRAFASHLAYDTMRWEGTLDWALGQVLSRSLAEVEPALLRVLRLGALQILRSGVPTRAAVDTSVALAQEQVPKGRAQGAGGFVNGVLRNLGRMHEQLPWPEVGVDPIAALELTTAHPRWIVSELHGRFGTERTDAILTADNQPPGLTLRATEGRDALVAELLEAGLDATAGTVAVSVRVPGADPRRLPAVRDGRAVPQDEASMRVVLACGVQQGDEVLDLCAGPGGKTTHLAALAGGEGRVTAVELHKHRAKMVARAAATQGLEVDVLVGDATLPLEQLVALEPVVDADAGLDELIVTLDGGGEASSTADAGAADPDAAGDTPAAGSPGPDAAVAAPGAGASGPETTDDALFDVALLDAPCTGLGTGRRRPEVRWRRQPEDVTALAQLQRRLLAAAAGHVRPGGRLVYAVCTWALAETEHIAEWFDAAHGSGFTPVSREQLWPDTDGTDGMFIAVWNRAEGTQGSVEG